MAEIKIEGRGVLRISCVSGQKKYSEESKMKGKTYRVYTYGGKAFIANDELGFYDAQQNGSLAEVYLDSNEEGQLSLTDFISYKQLIGMKKNELTLESLTLEAFKAENVDFAALVG